MIEEKAINYALNNGFAIIVAFILLYDYRKIIRQNTDAINKLTLLVEKLSHKIDNLVKK